MGHKLPEGNGAYKPTNITVGHHIVLKKIIIYRADGPPTCVEKRGTCGGDRAQ